MKTEPDWALFSLFVCFCRAVWKLKAKICSQWMGFPAVKHMNMSGFFNDFSHLINQKYSISLFFCALAYIELLGYFCLLLFALLLIRVLENNCFIFLVFFPNTWNNLLAVHFIIVSDGRWYLCLSFSKCMRSTVCLVPCLTVDSQFVRDLAGMAEVITGCHPPSFSGVSSSNSSSGIMMLCVLKPIPAGADFSLTVLH